MSLAAMGAQSAYTQGQVAAAPAVQWSSSMPGSGPSTSLPGSGDGIRMPELAGPAQINFMRGDLCHSDCLTIDFSVGMTVAVWLEERMKCITSKSRMNPSLVIDESKLASIKKLIKDPEQLGIRFAAEGASLSAGDNEVLINLFSAISRQSIDGSSTGIDCDQLELLSSRLWQFCKDEAAKIPGATEAANAAEKAQQKKKSKKAKKAKKPISIVVPCFMDQKQTQTIVSSAMLTTDGTINCIFNRAVASVAGVLYRSIPSSVSSPKTTEKSNNNKKSNVSSSTNNNSDNSSLGALLSSAAKSAPSASTPTVLYLNSYQLSINSAGSADGAATALEAGLVRCEGGADAEKAGNRLGFERLATVFSAGIVLEEQPKTEGDKVKSWEFVQKCFSKFGVDKAQISAVLVDGYTAASAKEIAAIKTMLGIADNIPVFSTASGDAAAGGCVLSAGQLESSKQYIRTESGEWTIAYQFAVADGCLGCDIGLEVCWPDAKGSGSGGAGRKDGKKDSFEVLFRSGSRLWKSEVGPVRPKAMQDSPALTPVKKRFQWNRGLSLGSFLGHEKGVALTSEYGWPKMRIYQRSALAQPGEGTAEKEELVDESWQLIQTLEPLRLAKSSPSSSSSSSTTASSKNLDEQYVESADVTLTADPATNTLIITNIVGRTVKERNESRRGWTQLFLGCMLPFLLIFLYHIAGHLHGYYVHTQQVAWLTDFYEKNAPEKLKDPAYVTRTLAKYKDKMFLLWRNLEKTYDVKWKPPASIVEGV